MVHLNPTEQGIVHDKKMADEEAFVLPDGIHLFQDSGYQEKERCPN